LPQWLVPVKHEANGDEGATFSNHGWKIIESFFRSGPTGETTETPTISQSWEPSSRNGFHNRIAAIYPIELVGIRSTSRFSKLAPEISPAPTPFDKRSIAALERFFGLI
jgi:hypothetical protein